MPGFRIDSDLCTGGYRRHGRARGERRREAGGRRTGPFFGSSQRARQHILDLHLNILSFALLSLAGVAYGRRRPQVLWPSVALFFPVSAWAAVATWWQGAPVFTLVLLGFTLGLSAVALLLFAVDVVFAPFCLEMTYLTPLCWILCPLLVLVNLAGLCIT